METSNREAIKTKHNKYAIKQQEKEVQTSTKLILQCHCLKKINFMLVEKL